MSTSTSTYFRMTFTKTHALAATLDAFAGHRWHTTAEIAVHSHYSPRQARRALAKLADDAVIERTWPKHGAPILWRVPELRACRYCGTTERSDHFHKNYRTGGWYERCVRERQDIYQKRQLAKEEAGVTREQRRQEVAA